jgi:predicted enzyme related to lactoylglutathione lyase
MNNGIRLVVYSVKDMIKGTTFYKDLLGVVPYVESGYYTGFKVGEQEIGLVPASEKNEPAGPLVYYEVDDIKQTLKTLLDGGAQELQKLRDVGGGMLVASLTDADGNGIGLRQKP